MKKTLFQSAARTEKKIVPVADTRNAAGGRAYSLSADEALCQFAVTGCFGNTFYTSAQGQLDEVKRVLAQCSPEVVADVAIYARKAGHMKEMPAVLCAALAGRKDPDSLAALRRAFPLAIDNGKMIRNFCQMVRSGQFGRKSFGTAVKRLVRNDLQTAPLERLYRDSVGNDPSLSDVIRMVRPTTSDKQRDALFGFITGSKKLDDKKRRFLPSFVKAMEAFKAGDGPMPEKAPFMFLTAHAKGEEDWLRLVQRASWTETRINLAAFNRHGVFKEFGVQSLVSDRLRNRALIEKARVFPYQLLAAYLNTEDVPQTVREALQDALEIAVENVPKYAGKTVVAVDTSGSMSQPVTGGRGSATSKMRCVDVASLLASCILRKNPTEAVVVPFDTVVHQARLNPRDSVMTNATALAKYGGGGTDCSAVLRVLNGNRASADLVVYVSDNESWADHGYGRGTGLMTEWKAFKVRNPKAKLVLIDLVPHSTSQAASDPDILRIGGFSDVVFDVIGAFLSTGESSFVDLVRSGAEQISAKALVETENGE